jgi:hypothetical protein
MHQHLSGRRDFAETMQVWKDKPEAMIYQSMGRAAWFTWLERPIGFMDTMTPIGPGKLLGEARSSLHSARNLSLAGMAGAPFDYLERGMRATAALSRGDFSRQTLDDVRRIMPGQNLIWLSPLYRATHDAGVNNPFGPGKGIDLYPLPTMPESEMRQREREPQP